MLKTSLEINNIIFPTWKNDYDLCVHSYFVILNQVPCQDQGWADIDMESTRVQCIHKRPPHHLWRVIPQTGPGKYYATTFCQKDFFQYVLKTFLSYVLHARLHRIRVTTRSKPTLAKGNIWEGMSNKITFSFHEYGFEDLCRGLKQRQHQYFQYCRLQLHQISQTNQRKVQSSGFSPFSYIFGLKQIFYTCGNEH